MTKREAHRIALRLAYEAVEKAVGAGGAEAGDDLDGQKKIDDALDAIAQQLYERARRYADKFPVACDCIASGNKLKPKQHGADPHAKNCRVYGGL